MQNHPDEVRRRSQVRFTRQSEVRGRIMALRTLMIVAAIVSIASLLGLAASSEGVQKGPRTSGLNMSNLARQPTVAYCQDLGYKYVVIKNPQGEGGACVVADGIMFADYDFLSGKAGAEYGYCARAGLQAKTSNHTSDCDLPFTAECTMCLLKNGSEMEATRLLTHDKATTGTIAPYSVPTTTLAAVGVCGDGICQPDESCSKDCAPGGDYTIVAVGVAVSALIALVLWMMAPRKRHPD